MGPLIRERAGTRDLLALAATFPDRYPALLESAARGNRRARFDILPAFPQRLMRLDGDGLVRDHEGRVVGDRFLEALDREWARERVDKPHDCALPFRGGWLVYLGYELANEVEPSLVLPRPRSRVAPTALALRCPAAVIIDHERALTLLVAEAGRADLLDTLASDLAIAAGAPPPLDDIVAIEEDMPDAFLDGVARITRPCLPRARSSRSTSRASGVQPARVQWKPHRCTRHCGAPIPRRSPDSCSSRAGRSRAPRRSVWSKSARDGYRRDRLPAHARASRATMTWRGFASWSRIRRNVPNT